LRRLAVLLRTAEAIQLWVAGLVAAARQQLAPPFLGAIKFWGLLGALPGVDLMPQAPRRQVVSAVAPTPELFLRLRQEAPLTIAERTALATQRRFLVTTYQHQAAGVAVLVAPQMAALAVLALIMAQAVVVAGQAIAHPVLLAA